MTNNLITVLMPVYNAEKYLHEAIDSILNQTYKHFELIIINDGSTDRSEEIIKSYKDPRIQYLKNNTNLGLSATLNKGLQLATGKYIARMDADDISHPARFEKQVAYLESHPDYGIVGSMYVMLDGERKIYEIGGMSFREDEEIKISLFSNNVFAHGETMFRKELIDRHNFSYNKIYNPCEDYYLWTQMSSFTKFHILENILYYYMISPDGMSGTGKKWKIMKRMVKRIARELQNKNGLPKVEKTTFTRFYHNGKRKIDGKVWFSNQYIKSYEKLNYQEFLFRTGMVYLKRMNLQGIQFLAISFAIHPNNWLKKFYRMIFRKHPRLKKRKKQWYLLQSYKNEYI
jgi:glycosyltransferase involved in cell wall biosynthesis